MYKETRLLILAARAGDLRLATRIIDKFGLSHRPDWWNGYKFLRIAAKNNKTAFVKFLLDRGCAVDGNTKTPHNTPLYFAVEKGNAKIIKLLLRKGSDINGKNKMGEAPLTVAVEKENLSTIELLLQYGANINVTEKDNSTPLHMACKNNFKEIARVLLNGGADINAITERGFTPLHIAIYYGSSGMVNALLQHGAKVDFETKGGQTALNLAVLRGDLTIVNAILKCQPDITIVSNQRSLEVALCNYGDERVVTALMDHGFSVQPAFAKNPEVLHGAVEKGLLEIVDDLLEYGADPNCVHPILDDGLYPLHRAVQNKQEQVVRLLISNKADVNSKDALGKPPIYYSVANINFRMTQILLSSGAIVKDFPEVLHVAVRGNFREIVEILVMRGVDVNARDIHGRTALHFTVFNENEARFELDDDDDENFRGIMENDTSRNVEIAQLLLNKGAKVNAKTVDGTTPLHLAVADSRFKDMVKLLLEYGADVSARDINGRVPIHSASDPDIIDALWTHGADVNAVCNDGKTAICYLSGKGDLRAVSTLIEYGADLNVGSTTPLDCALQEIMMAAYRDMMMFFDEPADLSFDDTSNFFVEHYIKMEVAGLKYKEPNLFRGELKKSVIDLKFEFHELDSMRKELVENTNVSYYDILKKDVRMMAKYMNNECMVLAFNAEEFRRKFPLYAGMLKGQFRRGLARMKLLEAARRVLQSLVDLPEVCTEKIMDDLNDEDLRVLIAAGNCEA